MALVERLMHDDSEPGSRHIAVHEFFAAVNEALLNGHTFNGFTVPGATAAQVQAYYAMTAADLADWDALAAWFPSGTTTAAHLARLAMANRIHGVFLLAEGDVTGYDTPAAVRGKLGI